MFYVAVSGTKFLQVLLFFVVALKVSKIEKSLNSISGYSAKVLLPVRGERSMYTRIRDLREDVDMAQREMATILNYSMASNGELYQIVEHDIVEGGATK